MNYLMLAHDCRKSIFSSPYRRIRAELICFLLIFIPHDGNNHLRKAITVIGVIVWATIEVGSAFELATPPPQFVYIRLFVGIILGRMWGIQFNNIAGVTFTPPDSQSQGDTEDSDDSE